MRVRARGLPSGSAVRATSPSYSSPPPPQVIPRLASALPLLKDRLRDEVLPNIDTLVIAFPDDGAHKRFHKAFADYDADTHIETITCSKVRARVRAGLPSFLSSAFFSFLSFFLSFPLTAVPSHVPVSRQGKADCEN